MNLEELRKALDKIPDDTPSNKARRAEIIKKILILMEGQKK